MPTLSLTNSIAFHHLKESNSFPYVRVLGTIGWIVAGILVGKRLHADALVLPMQIAAGASMVMAAYALLLPHTPPKATHAPFSVRDALGLDALAVAEETRLLDFCDRLIPAVHSAAVLLHLRQPVSERNQGAGGGLHPDLRPDVRSVLHADAGVSLLRRFGIKVIMLVGMLAWACDISPSPTATPAPACG